MSDIYINGESLKVDKKFDSVVIEGFDEIMKSLKPKIVLAGSSGGGGKQFLIDPFMLDNVGPLYTDRPFPDQYREYSILPINVDTKMGYSYNPRIVNVDGTYVIKTNFDNQNTMFFNALDSTKVKGLKFDMWTENYNGTWNQCFLNIGSSPKVTGYYEGNIDGVNYKEFLTNFRNYTVDQLNNQAYIDLYTNDQYSLPRQEFTIDIAGLVRDGIITGDVFYFGIQVCDCYAYIRKIEVIM